MKLTSWKKEIDRVANGDKIIRCTLSEEELSEEFDPDYRAALGKPFTAWSKKWEYFPACYDGLRWVAGRHLSMGPRVKHTLNLFDPRLKPGEECFSCGYILKGKPGQRFSGCPRCGRTFVG